jgi:hypothetical protein
LNNIVDTFSLYITKSTFSDGLMKWSAVNSDTESDLYGEKMTLGLYQKMLGYIATQTPPPDDFISMVCSEFWCGGMPYLSISHYPDLNGKAVPGQPLELFIDGNQLKAKGILFDNKLGQAVWKSLKKDENLGKDEQKIRISIAFLDLAHKHGESGKVFTRNSLTDVCPFCVKGVGNKIYLDGYLVHLALTRVPVNPRTIMEAEDIMAKKSIQTRKEDALSIVEDAELVEEIDKTALETKSDVLIEMSDTQPEPVEDSALVEDAKRTWKETSEKHTSETCEDDGSPEDTPDDKKKDKKKMKSLTEEVTEIVKSLLPAPVVDMVSEVKKSTLDIATDELYNSVNTAIQMQGMTVEQRLESINPALGNLGNAITAMVRESQGQVAPTPTTNDQSMVLEAVTSLTSTVKELAQEVAMLKEKSLTPQVNVPQNRIPVPRSIQPQLVAQSQAVVTNPNSITNIVRRSVSSSLPLK